MASELEQAIDNLPSEWMNAVEIMWDSEAIELTKLMVEGSYTPWQAAKVVSQSGHHKSHSGLYYQATQIANQLIDEFGKYDHEGTVLGIIEEGAGVVDPRVAKRVRRSLLDDGYIIEEKTQFTILGREDRD